MVVAEKKRQSRSQNGKPRLRETGRGGFVNTGFNLPPELYALFSRSPDAILQPWAASSGRRARGMSQRPVSNSNRETQRREVLVRLTTNDQAKKHNVGRTPADLRGTAR